MHAHLQKPSIRKDSIEASKDKNKVNVGTLSKPDTAETQNCLEGRKSATCNLPKTNSNKAIQKSVDKEASISPFESTSDIPLDVRLPKMDDEILTAKRAKTVDNRRP